MATIPKINWEYKTLSQLGFLSRGKSKHRPRNDAILYGGKYPFIQTSDIKHSNFYVNSYSQTYNEVGLAQSKLWQKDTLCMTIAANIAETALLSFPACFPDSVVGFIADPSKSNVKFIKYALDYGKREFQKTAKGTAQDNLSLEKIDNLKIKVPDVATQSYIAAVISAYDDLIENNEKRIKALEEMAQLLYTEWFVKFKFPGHEKSKMVDSGTKYGMIPEGWKVKKLNDLIKPQYGYTTSSTSNGEYKFLRGMDINKSSFIDWSSVPFCEIEEEEIEKYKINKGDIFIIRMADPGKIGICEQTVPAIFASYLMRLKITSELTSYYLFYFLNSKRYQGFINGTSNGTTRKSINSQQVGMINILVPPIDLLNDFENRAKKIRGFAMELIKKNGCVSLMRDLLIPQLVTGNKVLK